MRWPASVLQRRKFASLCASKNAEVPHEPFTPREAAEWLHEQALLRIPDYAKRFGVKIQRGARNPAPSSPHR
jgi:hypothetical protein